MTNKSQSSKLKITWGKLVQLIVIAVIIFFWFKVLKANWIQIAHYEWQINPIFLIVSGLIFIAQPILLFFIWQKILTHTGQKIEWRRGLKIYLLAQIARYVPGGFWDIASRVYLAKNEGLTKTKTSISILLEMSIHLIAALIVCIVFLIFWPNITFINNIYLLIALVFIGLFSLYPPVFNKILYFIAKILKRNYSYLPIKYKDVIILLVMYCTIWAIAGVGFFLFAKALYPMANLSKLLIFIGIFTSAWVIGFITIIAPMGIGVREGVMYFLLSFYMPMPMAIVISIGFRIWLTLRDFICAALATRL